MSTLEQRVEEAKDEWKTARMEADNIRRQYTVTGPGLPMQWPDSPMTVEGMKELKEATRIEREKYDAYEKALESWAEALGHTLK